MKKVISMILIFVLFTSVTLSAYAKENSEVDFETEYSVVVDCSMAAEEGLALGYSNLSPTAKQIYDAAISEFPELIAYHVTNIDSKYEPLQIMPLAANDAMSIVTSGLAGLSLPTEVQEVLTMLASGITAALADGPLVAGDIYAISISVYAAVVIASHWDEIMALWTQIVGIFEQAYASIKAEVTTSFGYVKTDIADERSIEDELIVHYSNGIIKVGSITYSCTVVAERVEKEDSRFYAAAIKDEMLFLCPKSIPFKAARAIMHANIQMTGVMTLKRALAKAVCDGTVVHHSAHGSNDEVCRNFFPHYHMVKNGKTYKTHSWYVI